MSVLIVAIERSKEIKCVEKKLKILSVIIVKFEF
jgi:hypothetical protein